MAFAEENHGTRILQQILESEGLAWIAVSIFDHLDGNSLKNCELVSKLWRQFFINGQLWKRHYLHKLAKPGTDAHGLIKSNPKLFQYQADQADQSDPGTFYIFCLFMCCSSASY
jgi:hypothetical protein